MATDDNFEDVHGGMLLCYRYFGNFGLSSDLQPSELCELRVLNIAQCIYTDGYTCGCAEVLVDDQK